MLQEREKERATDAEPSLCVVGPTRSPLSAPPARTHAPCRARPNAPRRYQGYPIAELVRVNRLHSCRPSACQVDFSVLVARRQLSGALESARLAVDRRLPAKDEERSVIFSRSPVLLLHLEWICCKSLRSVAQRGAAFLHESWRLDEEYILKSFLSFLHGAGSQQFRVRDSGLALSRLLT